ncbi:TetR family transcriptional regulator [Microtetraspora sp. NBRC 13810]|uniref:TetR/AcrR family transcriptional regulator n=1 Tax=Microtetraspora sp. NBRC 13810 TaxID=3030990 RepID=UPI0024A25B1A|nr:TetR/AcrR family transcriptional regulator [Microtetraspora sp. NBRC 13810]GLW09659.1 TetR family transcriptional regulator [Microtetraspora sp. NBRC 13810]
MTTEYTGSGDPRRSVELLWGLRDGPRRGPKPRFSVPQIARAAIELADAEGLAALSMRRVADRLGVTAMSLYSYVPGKAELLDVMVDTVYAETDRTRDPASGWRDGLEAVARDNWALYLRHPWLLQVAAVGRPVLGPHMIAKYDHELSAVDGIGLADVEMDLVLGLVTNYVHGAVRAAVEAAQVEQRTGLTDEQWWEAWAPVLGKVLDEGRHPVAARVGSAAGREYGAAYAPERSFEFGLQRLLDGIEVFVRGRSGRDG